MIHVEREGFMVQPADFLLPLFPVKYPFHQRMHSMKKTKHETPTPMKIELVLLFP